jgi:hypothetical protein
MIRRSGLALLAVMLLGVGQGGALAVSSLVAPSIPKMGSVVTLLTGERVVVGTSSGGSPMLRIIRSANSGPASQLRTARLNGDDYVIPATAEPYLGRYLDLRLFDVTQLAAAGVSARLPLRITFKSANAPSLPGVTITTAAHGVATGYVTVDSARAFGAALASQAVADSQAGWPASSPLFGSVTAIAPGVAAPAVVIPNFPQVTLIIKGISPSGGPIPFSFGFVMNVDNGLKYAAFVLMVNGEARVSLPLGHYMGLFDDFTFSPAGGATVRLMPFTGYDVTGDRQTLTIDSRLAVASPTSTTPRPSVAEDLSVMVDMSDATGNVSFDSGYELSLPGARILLLPAAPPAAGSLRQITRWIRVDPSSAGGHYAYDASFIDAGIPADQSHSVPNAARMATIDTTYDSDRLLRIGATLRLVLIPGVFFSFASSIPVPMPIKRTEYVYAPAGSTLLDSVLSDLSAWDPGIMNDDEQPANPGSVRSETWLRNPFGLGVPDSSAADQFPVCLACRSANAMTFVNFPTDGVPTHRGDAFGSPSGKPVAGFTVYRNGKLILDEPDTFGDVFAVPSAPARYRVVSYLDRFLTGSFLSTFIRSDVSFRSGASTGVPTPPRWFCYTAPTCRVLPVLRALVNLHATPQGTLPLGRSTFGVSVGHIAGAADHAITSVTVSVRRAGATKWTTIPVARLSKGRYQASFFAGPASNGLAMDLRVTAMDVEGGSLSQVTHRAFLVSS